MARKNRKTTGTFDNVFVNQNSNPKRLVNIRDERDVPEDKIFMNINFKDVDMNQCPPGQNYSDWEDLKLLSSLMKKFESICQTTRMEAVAQKYIKVYGKFPSNSHFKCPDHIRGDVEWATIQRVGGQKIRVAGYLIKNVFYPVFLDKDHLFYPSTKKHT